MKFAALPDEVKRTGLFCCWHYEKRGEAQTKVPYNPMTGGMAKSNDPSTFTTFDNACSQVQKDTGLGIGIFNGICGIDIDHCISDSGYYTSEASEVIELMHSYTEVSPSGNGVHILFRADKFQFDKVRYYIMNRQAGMEVYITGATNRYLTVTGNSIEHFPFGNRTEELKLFLERYMKKRDSQEESVGRNAINGVNPIYGSNTLLDDKTLLDKAFSCRNGQGFQRLWNGDSSGYPSQSEADMALCGSLAFWTGCNPEQMDRLFRQSGLMRKKWDRVQSGSTYGAITIQAAVRKCTSVYEPPKRETPNHQACSRATVPFDPIISLKPEKSQLPEFPVDCLPALIQEYVQAVAAHSQTAPDMAAVISLGVLAVCLQGKALVQGTPGYFEPLSLYTVVVAAPGERKSGVMRDMTQVLYDYEQEFNQRREPEIRSYRQKKEELERKISGLQKKLEQSNHAELELELKDLENQLEDLPEVKPVRFFADDCSSEALTSLLANNNGRFAVISTEGGIFDIMAGRYSNKTNIDVWLKGHCGDVIRVDRLGREAEYIPHPALSALLTIQPSVLDDIMSNDTMSGRGLIARFLYSCPKSQIGSRVFAAPPIPKETAVGYQTVIQTLMDLPAENPAILNLSERATDVISDYFREHERFLAGEGQAISDWASKYIGAILRIAGLLHMADALPDDRVIHSQTMRRAIRIGGYFLAHSTYAYSMMGTDLAIKKAMFVLAKLKKNQVTELKRSELLRMCRGKFFKKVEDLIPTLELLDSHNYVRLEEPVRMTAGRPPDWRVIVNPMAVQEGKN
jgi:hypothetical protein